MPTYRVEYRYTVTEYDWVQIDAEDEDEATELVYESTWDIDEVTDIEKVAD